MQDSWRYFYPRSPRGERPIHLCVSSQIEDISIHAPREGSDQVWSRVLVQSIVISIHAPREGSDLAERCSSTRAFSFLSTLPARGATQALFHRLVTLAFLSTLPARGATLACSTSLWAALFLSTLPARGATLSSNVADLLLIISIHAPREGSDVPHVVYGFI